MENYAGVEDCDEAIKQELIEAGIDFQSFSFLKSQGEVPTTMIGTLGHWTFDRAWSYWIAKGPGIPVDIAEKLHTTHGKEVRVDGDCGCPSPLEQFGGFGVGIYHIDTQEGLNALAKTIKSIMEANS